MALYLGNTRVKVGLGGTFYRILIPSAPSEPHYIRLITFDEFALADKDGVFLTAKEGE